MTASTLDVSQMECSLVQLGGIKGLKSVVRVVEVVSKKEDEWNEERPDSDSPVADEVP